MLIAAILTTIGLCLDVGAVVCLAKEILDRIPRPPLAKVERDQQNRTRRLLQSVVAERARNPQREVTETEQLARNIVDWHQERQDAQQYQRENWYHDLAKVGVALAILGGIFQVTAVWIAYRAT